MIGFIGLIIGIIVGAVWNINIPDKFSPYMSVAILACLDSVFGALRASLAKKFEADIFISGFFGNAVLAAALAYLGDKMGVPIYLAAVVVFGGRIFDNFGKIRRIILDKTKSHHLGEIDEK
ncbi:small basic family protein [Clostridium oceanicum]|uniref:Small basic family protein n=1 Tax=Clostridium oceanicum TaxID=1543 RepID=A0ABN1JP69_9CLOT